MASSSSTSDLLEHFKLDAVVTAEYTTHVEYRADPARGIRKQAVEKKWYKERCIGSGAFGDVWLEVAKEDDPVNKRAVKTIRKNRLSGVDFEKELLALSKFSKAQHQQEQVLVKFFGWFETSSMLYLSMEYFELGDLEKHIDGSISEDDIKIITTDVLNGLRIIHSENFAHRDLKPSNIFVVQKPPASDWWVKIGDFGISKRIQSNVTALRTQTGTPAYQAPEVSGYLDTDEPTSVYDNAVDMWSLGCVIYKIVTQNVPFPDPRMVLKYCSGKIPFPQQPLLGKMHPDGVEFVESLIVPEPRVRPSAVNALEAVWLLRKKSSTVTSSTESPMYNARTAAQTTNTHPNLPTISNTALQQDIPVAQLAHRHRDSNKNTINFMNKRSPSNSSPHQSSSSEDTGDKTIRHHQTPKAPSSPSFGKLLAPYPDEEAVRPWNSVKWELYRILKGHENSVTAVAFSPDNQLLASGSYDMTARLWDPINGKLLRTLKGHKHWVWAVAFSPDNQLLASSSYDKTINLWDPVTGELLRMLTGHEDTIWSIAFSLNNQLLASGSYDKTVKLWDPVKGQLLRTFRGHESTIHTVAFSPDSRLLASASGDGIIMLWDAANWNVMNRGYLRTLRGHKSSVLAVAFSPDGCLLASGSYDRTIGLWDPVKGSLLRTLRGHGGFVRTVAFSSDSQLLASGSDDHTAMLWDPAKGELLKTIAHKSSVLAVAISADNRLLASASGDKIVELWNLQ